MSSTRQQFAEIYKTGPKSIGEVSIWTQWKYGKFGITKIFTRKITSAFFDISNA